MKTSSQLSKNKFLLFTLSMLFCLIFKTNSFAQKDLIVKKDSTEIRCAINKETSKKYRYSFLNSKNKMEKTSILKTLVDTIYFNKFEMDSISITIYDVKKSTKKSKKEALVTEKDSSKSFKFNFGFGLNLENVLEFNKPNKPDKKTFSATSAIDLGLNYSNARSRFAMTNELHWTVAIQKSGLTGDDRIVRTSDELITLHDFSITLSKNSKWNFNLIAKSTTSIFTIFDGDFFKDYNEVGKNQAFLNPYDVTLSPGIKYQPNENFRVSISPYSVNMYGLLNQEIANTGYYTQTFDENNNYSLYIFTKLGADMNIWYDKKVKKWLDMQYRLSISSDYLKETKITGLLDGLFITKIRIFKNLSLAYRGVLKGDFVTQPFKPYYKQNILLSFSKTF
jgi:hypothetical protein